MEKKKIVILYSGGLDSFLLNKYALETEKDSEIVLIYWKHGCNSEESEISVLPNNVKIKTIDWLNNEIQPKSKKSDELAGNIYIPGRNLAFAVLAACQELPDEIWMGTLFDEYNEQATDKNEIFINKTENVLNYVLSPFKREIKIRFPFVENKWKKIDIISWALRNNVSEEEIKKHISCWNHKGVNCGECKQCFKRELVFRILGIKDDYLINPIDSESGERFIKSYTSIKNPNEDEKNVLNMIKTIKNNEK